MIALYVLGAILVVLLLGVILAPLLEEEPSETDLEELPPGERRDAAVAALRDVEFEYRTDKLPEEEYRRLRTRYGRIALRAEDELEGAGGRSAAEEPGDRATPAGRGDGAPAGASADAGPGGGDGPGTAAATLRPCPSCDADVPADARFCPRCGARQPAADGGGSPAGGEAVDAGGGAADGGDVGGTPEGAHAADDVDENPDGER